MRPRYVLRAVVARAGLLNRFHRVGLEPTDGIFQVRCVSCGVIDCILHRLQDLVADVVGVETARGF